MSEPLPPADADFQELAALSPGSVETGDDAANIAYPHSSPGNNFLPAEIAEYPGDDEPAIDGIPERTPSELRAIQRAMLDLSLDPNVRASERAQCARAYRDIELVRRAVRGKPLVLNPSMRVESRSRQSAPALTIIDLPDAKSA